MDRRQALKNIGLGAASMAMAPTFLAMFQSCQKENPLTWTPSLFTPEQGETLKRALNIIIPTTDTPGATDLNLHIFMDKYMKNINSEEQQQAFMAKADAFAASFENMFSKSSTEGSDEEYDQIIAHFLAAEPEARGNFYKGIKEANGDYTNHADAGAFSYLRDVRNQGINFWKNTEEIGENVLWYDPVPTEYIGCMDKSKANGGKIMSA